MNDIPTGIEINNIWKINKFDVTQAAAQNGNGGLEVAHTPGSVEVRIFLFRPGVLQFRTTTTTT